MPDETNIEVRYATLEDGSREFDEVVAADAHVHLEKMNDHEFALVVETRTERACFVIGAQRARVDARESWRDRIDRDPGTLLKKERKSRHARQDG